MAPPSALGCDLPRELLPKIGLLCAGTRERLPATNVTADLLNSGEIKLRWKGTTANGTFYAIWRRLNAGETFDLLGSVSAKSFVDTTIPVGTPEATYFLRTHRDELSSDDSEPITVRFGTVGLTDGNQNETAGNDGLGLAA